MNKFILCCVKLTGSLSEFCTLTTSFHSFPSWLYSVHFHHPSIAHVVTPASFRIAFACIEREKDRERRGMTDSKRLLFRCSSFIISNKSDFNQIGRSVVKKIMFQSYWTNELSFITFSLDMKLCLLIFLSQEIL